MYKFCRIVAVMAHKLWRYTALHEFSLEESPEEVILSFTLKLGNDSINHVVSFDLCYEGYKLEDSDTSDTSDTKWINPLSFTNELYDALLHHRIPGDKPNPKCTLKCLFPAKRIFINPFGRSIEDAAVLQIQNAESLRTEIENLCKPEPEGILVGVNVKPTTHRFCIWESGYKVKITLTDKVDQ